MSTHIARLVVAARQLLSVASAHRIHASSSVFAAIRQIDDAVRSLDAAPTQPAHQPPSDDELSDLCNRTTLAAFKAQREGDTVETFRNAGVRALYNRGLADMRARCVALLSKAAEQHREEETRFNMMFTHSAPFHANGHARAADALEEAAAAVEALGAEERTR